MTPTLLAEAYILNFIWDWANARVRQKGHHYYHAMAQEFRAIVRGYGRKVQ